MSLRKDSPLNPLREQVEAANKDEEKHLELWGLEGASYHYPIWNELVFQVLNDPGRFSKDNLEGLFLELQWRLDILNSSKKIDDVDAIKKYCETYSSSIETSKSNLKGAIINGATAENILEKIDDYFDEDVKSDSRYYAFAVIKTVEEIDGLAKNKKEITKKILNGYKEKILNNEKQIFSKEKFVWSSNVQENASPKDSWPIIRKSNFLFLLQNVYLYNADNAAPALIGEKKRAIKNFIEKLSDDNSYDNIEDEVKEVLVSVCKIHGMKIDLNQVTLPFEKPIKYSKEEEKTPPLLVNKADKTDKASKIEESKLGLALEYTAWILLGSAIGLSIFFGLIFFQVVTVPFIFFVGITVGSAVLGGSVLGPLLKLIKDKIIDLFSNSQKEPVVNQIKDKPSVLEESEKSEDTSTLENSHSKSLPKSKSADDLSNENKQLTGRPRSTSLPVKVGSGTLFSARRNSSSSKSKEGVENSDAHHIRSGDKK